MSKKIVMKHPKLGDARRTVSEKQFKIWQESGWQEDTKATNELNKEEEALAKLTEEQDAPAEVPKDDDK